MDPSAPDRWWGPFKQVGSARISHVDLRPHETREVAAFAWLDDAERSRWERFQHPPARRHYALCRAALRSILCEHLGCGNDRLSFETAEGGKPFAILDGRPVPAGFNVSHSGRHGLIALAPAGRIGVDVEECVPRDDLDRLAGAVFGPAEQTELAAASGDDRIRLFFRLWTLKEAVAKALGSGLSLDVSQFEVPGTLRSGESRGVLQLPRVSEVQWQLTVIDDERFAAAVAQEIGEPSR